MTTGSRLLVLLFCFFAGGLAGRAAERVFASVLPALAYGPSCSTTVTLRNAGNRPATVDVEAHQRSGALAALAGERPMRRRLSPGDRETLKPLIEEETTDAWIQVLERVPDASMRPIVAVSAVEECIARDQLITAVRRVAFPLKNPWYKGPAADMQADVIAVVNTSESAGRISICYSTGNSFALPGEDRRGDDGATEFRPEAARRSPEWKPVCSSTIDAQLPPFGSRHFAVQSGGSSQISLTTQGEAIVLEMLRPAAQDTRLFTVESKIAFGSEATETGTQ